MAPSQDRLRQWQQNRAAHLAAVGWIRDDTSRGHPARFVADELLVADGHQDQAQGMLTALGHQAGDISSDEVLPGFHRLRVPGMDVAAAVRRIRDSHPDAVVGANHVFLSTPYEHGGPFGPPAPVASLPSLPSGPDSAASVRLAIVDTGIWSDSPLPQDWYEATPDDLDSVIDVDGDGNIDSDVGHANFIAGVVLSATSNARIRIVKVLDSMGMCTEVQLANALLSLSTEHVVNLSLGGFTLDDQPPVLLSMALASLLSGTDRAVVAAAGNDGVEGRPFWPAAFAGGQESWSTQVLAVAAHDGEAICSWSNTGDWVSLAAPGVDIVSTYVNQGLFTGGWAQWSGTSFAAPYAAAALAQQVPGAGSVLAALTQVRQDAAGRTYTGWPGLA